MVVIETETGAKAGLVVDELIGQQQVVVKSLLENFDAVRGISGATILGNGHVALILDLDGLAAAGALAAGRRQRRAGARSRTRQTAESKPRACP